MSAASEQAGFGHTAARGALYTGAAQICRVAITLLSTIAVARMLSPDDFGVIAMTAPITGFLLLFQNLGLGHAIIQAKVLSDHQKSALFAFNMLASLTIALALLLLSPLIALFYDDPRPGYIAAASGITVLVTASGLQHTALLTRSLRFKRLGAIDVASATAILIFSLAFAYLLDNYWAIWVGTLAGAIVNALLVWSSSTWRPSLKMRFSEVRPLMTFGANLTGFNILNYLTRNLDNVLIAKFWGPYALGLYDRSYRLMMFPIQNVNAPLERVMLPALSRVQDEPARFRRIYLRTIRTLSLASTPGIIAAAICSDRLIPFLLGDHWRAASPIFFWLSLAAISQPISNSTGWLFTATGQTRILLRWGMISAPITIVSFIAGLPWGAEGVAAAYFLGQIVRMPILYHLCAKHTPVRAMDLYAAFLPTLAGGALTAAAIVPFRFQLATVPLFIVTASLCYALSAATQTLTPGGRETLRAIFQLLGHIVPHKQT